MRETFNIRTQDRQHPRAGKKVTLPYVQVRIALIALILTVAFLVPQATGQTLTLSTAPGGIAIAGPAGAFTGSFGTMNALGVGTPSAGVTNIVLSNGTLYYTPYHLRTSALGGAARTASVTAYVSTNFAHPAAFTVESCPTSSPCNASGQYSVMSTSSATPTTIITSQANNVTSTAGLALFLPDNNGASQFTGTDSVRITFTITNLFNGNHKTVTLTLSATLQNAVQLTLGTAPGGATITPAADFNLNFGNVNALGIGPGAGLATTAVAGGNIYHTAYLLNPVFSAMTSTTGTIKVYVSTNFAHPALLILNDASATNGPYSAISTNAGAQTQITNAATDRSSITRYLGLFVSNVNGATAFNGSDTATLTFTLTVP